jgi:hypothetical protein
MPNVAFHPRRRTTPPVKILTKPDVTCTIWAKKHTQIYHEYLDTWSSSAPAETRKWKGHRIIGLGPEYSSSYIDLTKTITLEEDGKYWALIKVPTHPLHVGSNVTLSIDGETIGSASTYMEWEAARYIDFGFITLTAGNRNFNVRIDRKSYASDLVLYKMEEYTNKTNDRSKRLNIESIEYTQNTVIDLNTLTLKLNIPDEWHRPDLNPYSGIVFDFTDHITLQVGTGSGDKRIVFGGYIVGHEYGEHPGQLTLNCVDRMLDLYREPLYVNYAIGVTPSSDEQSQWPHIQFGSIYEAVRHIGQCAPYPINTSGIEYPYGFHRNYANPDHYNTVDVLGFAKSYDKRAGNPPPCLKLYYDDLKSTNGSPITGFTGRATIFDDDSRPYDATEYEMLEFDYMAPGRASGVNRFKFHVVVTMYKDGEDSTSAQDYTILFTGKSGATGVIGSVTPALNGRWRKFSFNLKEAFDRGIPSAHYYITKVEFKGSIDQADLNNRQNSYIYIDNISSLNKENKNTLHIDQATNYPFQILQQICEESSHVAYIEYAEERKDDILCLAPVDYEETPTDLEFGENVIKIDGPTYSPRETLANAVFRNWSKDMGETQYTSVTYTQDDASIARYGPFHSYDNLSDVVEQSDADLAAEKYLNDNAYGFQSYSITIPGNVLLNPAMYTITKLGNFYLYEEGSIKSMIHYIDLTKNSHTTQIDVGKESRRYQRMIGDLSKTRQTLANVDKRTIYDRQALINLGFVGVQGFITTGY